MSVLAILAGSFISIGAIFSMTVAVGNIFVKDAAGATALLTRLPYGVICMLTGLFFTVGLILVVVGGAEVFTGNTPITMILQWKGNYTTTVRGIG